MLESLFDKVISARIFSCEYCEIFKNIFFYNTSGGCFYESISDIDRFHYLKKYLSGPELGTTSGLTLSSASYWDTLTILTGKYGNHQVLT